MYFAGEAICKYLETKLIEKGFKVPFYCNEDWGWWMRINGLEIPLALQIYCLCEGDDEPQEYYILSSVRKEKVWVWHRFRSIEAAKPVTRLMDDLEAIFHSDREIESVTRHDDIPW